MQAQLACGHGMWLSLVERSVRDREVEGSNPFIPTIITERCRSLVYRNSLENCRGVCHRGFESHSLLQSELSNYFFDNSYFYGIIIIH